jgi:hypothetical protein
VQALWKAKYTRDAGGYSRFLSSLRICDINDRDGLYSYIRKEFPGLFYILARAPVGADKREGAYRGMYPGGDASTTSGEWIDSHVRLDHGALGRQVQTRREPVFQG